MNNDGKQALKEVFVDPNSHSIVTLQLLGEYAELLGPGSASMEAIASATYPDCGNLSMLLLRGERLIGGITYRHHQETNITSILFHTCREGEFTVVEFNRMIYVLKKHLAKVDNRRLLCYSIDQVDYPFFEFQGFRHLEDGGYPDLLMTLHNLYAGLDLDDVIICDLLQVAPFVDLSYVDIEDRSFCVSFMDMCERNGEDYSRVGLHDDGAWWFNVLKEVNVFGSKLYEAKYYLGLSKCQIGHTSAIFHAQEAKQLVAQVDVSERHSVFKIYAARIDCCFMEAYSIRRHAQTVYYATLRTDSYDRMIHQLREALTAVKEAHRLANEASEVATSTFREGQLLGYPTFDKMYAKIVEEERLLELYAGNRD